MPKSVDPAVSFIFAVIGASCAIIGAFGIVQTACLIVLNIYRSPISLLGGTVYFMIGSYIALSSSPSVRKSLIKLLPDTLRTNLLKRSIIDIVTPAEPQPSQQSSSWSWSGYAVAYILIVMSGFLDREDVLLLTESLPKEMEYLRRPAGLVQLFPLFLRQLLDEDGLGLVPVPPASRTQSLTNIQFDNDRRQQTETAAAEITDNNNIAIANSVEPTAQAANYFRFPRRLRDERAILLSLEHDIATATATATAITGNAAATETAASIHVPDDNDYAAATEDFRRLPVAAASTTAAYSTNVPSTGIALSSSSPLPPHPSPSSSVATAAVVPVNVNVLSLSAGRLSFEGAIQQVVARHIINRATEGISSGITSRIVSTGRSIINGGDISDHWLASSFLAASGLSLGLGLTFASTSRSGTSSSISIGSSSSSSSSEALLLSEPSSSSSSSSWESAVVRSVHRCLLGISVASGAVLCSRHLSTSITASNATSASSSGHAAIHNIPAATAAGWWRGASNNSSTNNNNKRRRIDMLMIARRSLWRWYQTVSQSLQVLFADGVDTVAAAPLVTALALAALLTSLVAWRFRRSAKEMRWLFNMIFHRLCSGFGGCTTNELMLIGSGGGNSS